MIEIISSAIAIPIIFMGILIVLWKIKKEWFQIIINGVLFIILCKG